jgi:glycosyltransferase involved in cell wall biosynthesis
MTKLRIANFLAHYPEPGGTTTAVRGLSRALIRRGWEIVIYCCAQRPRTSESVNDDGIEVVQVRRPGCNPFYVDAELLARLAQNKDHIHLLVLHGMFNPANLAMGRAARRGGIPYVVCPHDPYHPELLRKRRWRKSSYGILFERPFLNAASAIQVLAQEHRALLSTYGVSRPVIVIPNGFDPEEVPDSNGHGDRASTHGEAYPRFLYLGRLDLYHKGLDLLLMGLALGLRQGKLPSTLRLDLVGADWGDTNTLHALARNLKLTDNVRFVGKIANRSPWAIIASYDVLVLPSRFDGFGLVALEAMVAGRPVVVSEQAGISTYVKQAQCGYVIQADSESICSGLTRALETQDEWHKIGAKGKQFAYEHLTWDKSAEHACHEYRKLLSKVNAYC